MQHEWINVSAQLRDHEGYLVGHEPADEVNVTAEAV